MTATHTAAAGSPLCGGGRWSVAVVVGGVLGGFLVVVVDVGVVFRRAQFD